MATVLLDKLNLMVEEALTCGFSACKSKDELKKLLNFDDANLMYFLSIYSKYKNSSSKQELIIGDGVFPTAIASKELMKKLPYVEYNELLKEKDRYTKTAKKIRLWLKKMQAGTGSSIKRTNYLSELLKVSKETIKLGAKGTDLYVEIKDTKYNSIKKHISLAELQILQSIVDSKKGLYAEIIFHDVVSVETLDSVNNIWETPCLLEPSKTYMDYINSTHGLMKFKESIQAYQPTVDENNQLSFNRTNPGGHGFIAVDAIASAYVGYGLPSDDSKNLIGVVGNGEDLGSTPDTIILGWMLENKIPIIMITTDKTELDMKGGQISIVESTEGFYVTIIEKAQAEAVGQLKLFEELGLRKEDKKSFFNTNIAVFNYDVLTPIIQEIIKEIGVDAFLKIITPDLIENIKKQKDQDGVERSYKQLEGAMASSILNLDRFWRKKYGTPLVSFVNVDRNNRTKFFSPVKTAFDFFIQFYSDRFKFDTELMRLIDKRQGALPFIDLKEDYYNDAKNVLDSFNGVSTLELDSLIIKGKVKLNGFKLVGNVEIINETDELIDMGVLEKYSPKILKNTKEVLR